MLGHFTLSLFLSLGLTRLPYAIETGNIATPLENATFDDQRLNTIDAKGEVLTLNIWASWCEYCREVMPALETYYRRHKKEGLRIIAITVDEGSAEGKARDIFKAYSFIGGIGRLSKLTPLGNISRLPLTFVFDRQGILRRHGLEDSPKIDLATLEKEVTPLLKNSRATTNKISVK